MNVTPSIGSAVAIHNTNVVTVQDYGDNLAYIRKLIEKMDVEKVPLPVKVFKARSANVDVIANRPPIKVSTISNCFVRPSLVLMFNKPRDNTILKPTYFLFL